MNIHNNKKEYKSKEFQEIFGSHNFICTSQETSSRAKASLFDNNDLLQINLNEFTANTINENRLFVSAGLLKYEILKLISIVREEKEILELANEFDLMEVENENDRTFYSSYIAPVLSYIF